MATATRLKFGPTDHGRPVTAEEAGMADYVEGYNYEIIDGRFYVSPVPNAAEGYLDDWLTDKLRDYVRGHPEVANHLSDKARVFVPNRPELTVPEPDITVFRDYPHDAPIGEMDWENFTPILVVEVLVESDSNKDLVRNVDLYLLVPSIAEYWILDGRANPDEPTLLVRRRGRKRWVLSEIPYGEEYSPPTLPGLTLLVDPRK